MSAVAGTWADRLQDAVGPLVVKEVRQGLRARVFAIFFSLLLAVCVVIALVAYADGRAGSGYPKGDEYFIAFFVALGGVCFFIIPYTAFRSTLREQEEETWVLLALTGLGARRIVYGKYLSAASQSALFASAGVPFLIFAYFLNGISVVDIAGMVWLGACWSSLLTAVAVALATQAKSRQGRAAANLLTLALLGGACLLTAPVLEELDRHGLFTSQEFRAFSVAFTWVCGMGTVLALEGGAAGVSLDSEPASRGPRLALVAFVVGGWAFFVGAALHNGSSTDADDLAAGVVICCLFLLGLGFFAVSERDGWPKASASEDGWLKPGALRSYWLVVSLFLGTWLVWLLLASATDHLRPGKPAAGALGAPLYCVLYLSLGVLNGRWLLWRTGEPLATRVGFITVTLVGTIAPPLVAALGGARSNDVGLNLLNPVVGLVNFFDKGRAGRLDSFVVLGAVTAVVCVVAHFALARRDEVRRA